MCLPYVYLLCLRHIGFYLFDKTLARTFHNRRGGRFAYRSRRRFAQRKDESVFFSLDIKRNIASGDISRGLLYGDDFDFVCVGNRVLQRFEKRFFDTVAIFERSYDVLFKENFVDIAVDIGKKTAFVAHVQTTTLEVVAV